MTAASARRVADDLGGDSTSRSVAHRLRELGSVGLVDWGPRARRLKSGRIKSYHSGGLVYSPTRRGREVDRILARITPSRGGEFAPMTTVDVALRERLVLAH